MLWLLVAGGTGAGEQRHARIKQKMTDYLLAEIDAMAANCGIDFTGHLGDRSQLNAQGLGVWLDSRKA
jgi:hypothetical protein